jgi:hypothetical protein
VINKILIGLISGLILLAIYLLLISVWPEPSPETVARRNDEQRVEDLGLIIEAVHNFRGAQQRLPYTLQELAEATRNLRWQDPVTGEAYEYVFVNKDVYSLCATFETDAADSAYGNLPGFSRHGIGHACIYRTFELMG